MLPLQLKHIPFLETTITVLIVCLPLSSSTVLINGIQTAKSFNILSMAPCKINPLYLFAKLYDASGKQHKALEMANVLLNNDVEMQFGDIDDIKEVVRTIIENMKEREQTMNNISFAIKHQFW
jgi:hypothetical protein